MKKVRGKNFVPSEYEMELTGRKAIYVPYAQAIPNVPTIDREACLYFKTGKCQLCVKACENNAIHHDMEDEIVELDVGAIVLAGGFDPFDPSSMASFGYATNENVVTAMEMERILSPSGPYKGHLVRPSDGQKPKRIAWLQCVGSRDINRCENGYCSAVCCMYAIKTALVAKEHEHGDLDCSIFYMDMRTHGKEFERYYDAAKKEGIHFIRSRFHSCIPSIREPGMLEVRYIDENGEIQEVYFDMVVLSVGMELKRDNLNLLKKLELDLTAGNFCWSPSFAPTQTSKSGIFVCGAFQGPRDIPQAVVDASAAAASVGNLLSPSKNTLIKEKETVPEKMIQNDRPRIGVFVCHCGVNISSVVDIQAVCDAARELPYVDYVTDNLYACSQDTQESIRQIIEEKGLNRVVIAACTPKTHEPLFQDTLADAGLNKYLIEMANIRNHDSWVHPDHPDMATEKAIDLVRMAVSKVALANPLHAAEVEINQTALVIGGGLAGMAAAQSLALQGHDVHLIEKEEHLGGEALLLYKTAKGEIASHYVANLIANIESNPKITCHFETDITKTDGFVGNFISTLKKDSRETDIAHGIAIVATGAKSYVPSEYGYGTDPRIMTSKELDIKLMNEDSILDHVHSTVFIQCVGSRIPERNYCSRICCTHTMRNAIELKEQHPDMAVYVLYRDLRTYGEKEYLYQRARELGVIFIRYTIEDPPNVSTEDGKLQVTITDHILNRPLEISTDLLVLASAVVPPDNVHISQLFKVPLNQDGFFVERHAKLGPVEFASDGVFLCGLAHYPKPVDEAIAQGQAAAAKAITLLAKKTMYANVHVANVQTAKCTGCGVCVTVCPYKAPEFITEGPFTGKSKINPALCKGCGLCPASCRSSAIALYGFNADQVFAQIQTAEPPANYK